MKYSNVDQLIEGPSDVAACQITKLTLKDYDPSIAEPLTQISWQVDITPIDTNHADEVKAAIQNQVGVIESIIPGGKLTHDTAYRITATVNNPYGLSYSQLIQFRTLAAAEVKDLMSPQASIFKWWKLEASNALIACSVCSSTPAHTCSTCRASGDFELTSENICRCQERTKFVDLTDPSDPQCKNKGEIALIWKLQKRQGSTYTFYIEFSNPGFMGFEENAQYFNDLLEVELNGSQVKIVGFSSTRDQTQNRVVLTLKTSTQVEYGALLTIKTITEYNNWPYTPFYISTKDQSYEFFDNIYEGLNEVTVKQLESAGKAMTSTLKAQSAATSIIPIILGGVSTAAILLIEFMADVETYRYINVLFPNNFRVFFKQAADSFFLPNIFAGIKGTDLEDVSEIGKFQEWGTSTVFLDNSGSDLIKELVALIVIFASSLMAFIFRNYPRISSKAKKVGDIFRWNTFLAFYIGDFSEFLLNSMIQFREHPSWTFYNTFSLILSIFITASFLLLWIYSSKLINGKKRATIEHQKQTTQPNKSASGSTVPSDVRILTEDFSQTGWLSKNFMMIMMLQNLVVIFVIFFLPRLWDGAGYTLYHPNCRIYRGCAVL